MQRLCDLIGTENNLDFVNRTLRDYARGVGAAEVGAMHITCSDECEREAVESFQQWFAQEMLPELKLWNKSPFRIANIGSRYEWGAIPVAEHHYATPVTRDTFKLLLVKINAHVCVVGSGESTVFGKMDRYESESVFCGGLHAMLDHAQLPVVADLRETFLSEGKDRVAALNDPEKVDPRFRSLFVAVANARLQGRRTILDIQNYEPATPTLYAVISCVTLNRKQRDTELVVGRYTADTRPGEPEVEYLGLGDDPSKYRVSLRHNMLQVEDDQLPHKRDARDHREKVHELWKKREQPAPIAHERLNKIARSIAQRKHDDPRVAIEIFRSLLTVLSVVAPIPAAVLLFVSGAAGIHNVYRAYRLAHGSDGDQDAQAILEEILARAESLPEGLVRKAIDRLSAHIEEV